MPCSGSPCELMRAQVVISQARSLSTASPTSELFSYIQFKIIPNVGGIVRQESWVLQSQSLLSLLHEFLAFRDTVLNCSLFPTSFLQSNRKLSFSSPFPLFQDSQKHLIHTLSMISIRTVGTLFCKFLFPRVLNPQHFAV